MATIMDDDWRQKVLTLLTEMPEGCTVGELCTHYTQRYHLSLAPKKHGFLNTKNMLKSLGGHIDHGCLTKGVAKLSGMPPSTAQRDEGLPPKARWRQLEDGSDDHRREGAEFQRRGGSSFEVESSLPVAEGASRGNPRSTPQGSMVDIGPAGAVQMRCQQSPAGLALGGTPAAAVQQQQPQQQPPLIGDGVSPWVKKLIDTQIPAMAAAATASSQEWPSILRMSKSELKEMQSKQNSPVKNVDSQCGAASRQLPTAQLGAVAQPQNREQLLAMPEIKEVVQKKPKKILSAAEKQDADRYHASMRQVHHGVMQGSPRVDPGRRPTRHMGVERVNEIAADCIKTLGETEQHVSPEKVIQLVCQHLQVQFLKDVGIRDLFVLPVMNEFVRTHREVNLFIEAFEKVRCISTLYELGQCLAALKEKQFFREIGLGPLCRHPLVQRLFKVPHSLRDDDIYEITTVDILQSLRTFMAKSRSSRGKGVMARLEMPDFLKHLMEQYGAPDIYDLGIRITSIPLGISVIGKAQKGEREVMDRGLARIECDIKQEVEGRLHKIKKHLLESFPLPGTSADLRRQFTTQPAAEIVLQVFQNAEAIFVNKLKKCVQDFLRQVKGDTLAQKLFQLALCCGSLETPRDLVVKEKPAAFLGNISTPDTRPPPPPEKAVAEQLVRLLSHASKMAEPLGLPALSRVEKQLAEHFDSRDLPSLGLGSFLDILHRNTQLLEETGVVISALGGSGATAGSFCPKRDELIEFIRQCGSLDTAALPAVDCAVGQHYGVHSCRNLGHGPVANLVKLVQKAKPGGSSGGGDAHRCAVLYETALCARDSRQDFLLERVTVGLQGDVGEEQALRCLLGAPLLEDLATWSHWELLFEPQLGALKKFIERGYSGKVAQLLAKSGFSELLVLEVKPGLLLRLDPDPSPDKFDEAALRHDPVVVAGQLVSMVTADGLGHAPLALLANRMESVLASMAVGRESSMEDEESSGKLAARFVLDCLCRIPLRLCKALAPQVLLEPCGRALGQTRSRELLGRVATDPRDRLRLQQLGLLLGITEWSRELQRRMQAEPHAAPRAPLRPVAMRALNEAFKSAAAAASDSDLTNGSEEEEESGSVESESKSDSESEDEETSDSSGDEEEDCQKFALAPSTYEEVEEKTDEVEEKTDEVVEEVASDVVPDADEAAASEGEGTAERTNADGDVGEGEEAPVVEEIPPTVEDPCRAIVEDIRRHEFGIGVELSEDAARLMEVQQSRIGRSLERLSSELYSKDTHFVLELVQNADDNSYPSGPDAQPPSLLFVVENDRVTLLNNEVGFSERNVRYICDIGKSTKGKHKYGYIGQKGIGFKSVFKVTDRPEIHSNGFHLRFDRRSGPMGLILPHWVDEGRAEVGEGEEEVVGGRRPLDLTGVPGEEDSWMTRIVLPLKSESHQTRNLFRDVHPSLLLFLHRLRVITIVNKVDGSVQFMQQRELGDGVVEIEHSTGCDRWLLVKKTLNAAKMKENVEATELALAFPLEQAEPGERSGGLPSLLDKQPVFAFLPLRSYGFRFIIQGDFEVPSSREDVDRDSAWNQWLRSEIPGLFLQALHAFTHHSSLDILEGLSQLLRFVPLPDEILDFFRPVVKQILQQLKATPCLPIQGPSGEPLEFRPPSETTVARDELVREVVSPALLAQHLGLAYLHPAVARGALSPALARELGVHTLSADDVLAVARAILREADAARKALPLDEVARLLVCVYRCLEQQADGEEETHAALRSLPIIPLADGRMVALADQEVFFPPGWQEGAAANQNKVQMHGVELLKVDLCVLHPDLLCCVDALCSSQLVRLLERLHVRRVTPAQVIARHVKPILESGAWKDKPNEVVISYLAYVKAQCEHDVSVCDLSELRATLPVLTSSGAFVRPVDTSVYFSTFYGNKWDLPTNLPGADWLLVHPVYMQGQSDVDSWRDFLGRLGVRDLPIVRKERRSYSQQDLDASPWAGVTATLPPVADGHYTVEDWVCAELHALLTASQLGNARTDTQRRLLLCLLDGEWDKGSRYSQYKTARVLDSVGRPLKEVDSSFLIYLTTLPWLPAEAAGPSSSTSPSFGRARDLYLRASNLQRLLGRHAAYVAVEMSANSTLAGELGVRMLLNAQELVKHLKRWCSGGAVEEEGVSTESGVPFCTSPEHIHAVYEYLQAECSNQQLQDLFRHYPAVFVPDATRRQHLESGESRGNDGGDGAVQGCFRYLHEVCWADPTRLFLRYASLQHEAPPQLQLFYGRWTNMADLFQQTLKVSATPKIKQYADLLCLVCEGCTLPNAEVLQDVSLLYAMLAEKCVLSPRTMEVNPDYCNNLKATLSKERIFPTKRNCWVSLESRPLVADDRNLEALFRDEEKVCFLSLPDVGASQRNKQPDRLHMRTVKVNPDMRNLFLRICDVGQLSGCVRTRLETENYRPCAPLRLLVGHLVPHVQAFLMSRGDAFRHVYDELTLQRNIAATLKTMNFSQVGKLYVLHTLTLPGGPDGSDGSLLVRTVEASCRLQDTGDLCIQKDHVQDNAVRELVDIFKELARLFSCEDKDCQRDLENFLHKLSTTMNNQSPNNLRRFLAGEGVEDLPEDEPRWMVPKPAVEENPPAPKRPEPKPREVVAAPKEETDEGPSLTCWPPRASMALNTNAAPTCARKTLMENIEKMFPSPQPEHTPQQHTERHFTAQGGEPGGALPHLPGAAPQGCNPAHGQRSGSGPSREEGDVYPHGPSAAADGQAQLKRPASLSADGRSSDESKDPEGSQSTSRGATRSPSALADSEAGAQRRPAGSVGPPQHPPQRVDGAPSGSTDGGARQRGEEEATRGGIGPDGDATGAVAVVATLPRPWSRFDPERRPPPLALGVPVWEHGRWPLDGGAGEELALSSEMLPDQLVLPPEHAGESARAVGRWGEQLVLAFLLAWKDDQNACPRPTAVEWTSEHGQSDLPYDFVVHMSGGEQEELLDEHRANGGAANAGDVVCKDAANSRERIIYVEVKSSLLAEKMLWEISPKEMDLALSLAERYHLYRVCNAGDSAAVRLHRVTNLAQRLHRKQLKLFLFV
ncbi:LOW QUALITY PROTEIN: uncharacterized protein LOC144730360 [Lampetra planeri]